MSALPPAPPASTPGVRAVMQGNRRRDTAPEVALRSALHRRGLRFRVDLRIGQGRSAPRPDVSFPRQRIALFVDGCFWHSCPTHGNQPKTNAPYWVEKLHKNKERDAHHTAALETSGWTVLRLWEHEDPQEAAGRVEALVRRQAAS